MHSERAQEVVLPAPASEAPANPVVYKALHFRLRGAAVMLPVAAVVIVSALLTPNAKGAGTHEQMGISACSLLRDTGWPCPTCGMTTSFSAAVHGQLGLAFSAQPFAPVLLAFCMVLGAFGGAELLTGKNLLPLMRMRLWWVWALCAGTLAGWGAKVLMEGAWK